MIEVRLQFAAQLYDNSVWLFYRDMELPLEPYPGMRVQNGGIPVTALTAFDEDCNTVYEVTLDLASMRVLCVLCGSAEKTYNRDELLASLGAGWHAAEEPLKRGDTDQPAASESSEPESPWT